MLNQFKNYPLHHGAETRSIFPEFNQSYLLPQ